MASALEAEAAPGASAQTDINAAIAALNTLKPNAPANVSSAVSSAVSALQTIGSDISNPTANEAAIATAGQQLSAAAATIGQYIASDCAGSAGAPNIP
jgi:homoserine dehydrogenase